MNNCPRLGKIFGCKFESRYDYLVKIDQPFESLKSGIPEPISMTINSFKTTDKVYVCDICVRCGKKVDRNDKP